MQKFIQDLCKFYFTDEELESDRFSKLKSEHAHAVCHVVVAARQGTQPGQQLQGQHSGLAEVGHDTDCHGEQARAVLQDLRGPLLRLCTELTTCWL